MKAFVTLGYNTGMRVGEITSLTWKQVDLKRGTIRLEVRSTKNKEVRTIYLLADEKQMLSELKELRKKRKAFSTIKSSTEQSGELCPNLPKCSIPR